MAVLLTRCAREMGHDQPWGEESRESALPEAHRVPSTDSGAGHSVWGLTEDTAASQTGELSWGM